MKKEVHDSIVHIVETTRKFESDPRKIFVYGYDPKNKPIDFISASYYSRLDFKYIRENVGVILRLNFIDSWRLSQSDDKADLVKSFLGESDVLLIMGDLEKQEDKDVLRIASGQNSKFREVYSEVLLVMNEPMVFTIYKKVKDAKEQNNG